MSTLHFLAFKKRLLLIIPALLLLCVAGWFGINAVLDPYDNRIVPNVSIGGVEIGEMTRGEAREALETALEGTLLSQQVTVALPQQTLALSPAAAVTEVRIRDAVEYAFQIGRTGTEEEMQSAYNTAVTEGFRIGLLDFITVDQEGIRSLLESYAGMYDTQLTEASYQMQGDMPQLGVAQYDPAAPCQTLQITMGIPTTNLDVDAVMAMILNVYDQAPVADYQITVAAPQPTALPAAPDLEAMYQEFYIAPVDDSLDMQTYQQVPGAYGYAFDMEAAKAAVAEAGFGETVSIPMIAVEPEILGDEVYFRDVLGTCETKHNNNENRNTNLRLLCAALDGKIIMPGEEFSYNETLGERTAEKGYKPAPAYSGNRLTDAIGGGVCQGSTTLYNCVLLADLEVTNRVCHGATVNYVPIGLDAAVNWGTTDFCFRNNFNFPVMIRAEVSDGYVKMQLLGTDEKDYYVKMTSGYDDSDPNIITAVSYKYKYDKVTGEQISKEREAFSTYYRNIG